MRGPGLTHLLKGQLIRENALHVLVFTRGVKMVGANLQRPGWAGMSRRPGPRRPTLPTQGAPGLGHQESSEPRLGRDRGEDSALPGRPGACSPGPPRSCGWPPSASPPQSSPSARGSPRGALRGRLPGEPLRRSQRLHPGPVRAHGQTGEHRGHRNHGAQSRPSWPHRPNPAGLGVSVSLGRSEPRDIHSPEGESLMLAPNPTPGRPGCAQVPMGWGPDPSPDTTDREHPPEPPGSQLPRDHRGPRPRSPWGN